MLNTYSCLGYVGCLVIISTDNITIFGFYMTSLKSKLQNYWSFWDFTFMMYRPHAKMATIYNYSFVHIQNSLTNLVRVNTEILYNFCLKNEVSEVILNTSKRIILRQPFLHRVYKNNRKLLFTRILAPNGFLVLW